LLHCACWQCNTPDLAWRTHHRLKPAALHSSLLLLLLLQPWETAKVSEGVRLQSPDTVRAVRFQVITGSTETQQHSAVQ
jgi:hypothetical protein